MSRLAAIPTTSSWIGSARFLWAVLLVSIALRAALAVQGGQYYFYDETRYSRGALVYLGLIDGNLRQVAEHFGSPEHAGFTFVALALAPLQHLIAGALGHGDWSVATNYYATASWGATLLGLSSVLNILLLQRIARAAGASPLEANLAALLAAASTSLFYFSRHLLPYDAALTAALGSLYFAVRARKNRDAFFAGACAVTCFEIYNGYWYLVPTLAAIHAWSWPGDARSRARAFGRWAGGGTAAALVIILPGALSAGRSYWSQMAAFSHTVTQGLFSEGWLLPWEYLLQAERGLAVLVLGAIVAQAVATTRSPAREMRQWRWLAATGAAWALLTFASCGLEKFVVYGRTVRPLAAFLCLAGAGALARLSHSRPRLQAIVVLLIVLCTVANFSPHLCLVFPHEIRQRVWTDAGVPKRAVAFSGTMFATMDERVTRPDLALVNTNGLFPLRDYIGYPKGEVLLSLPHPVSLHAYQYEGHTPRERWLLRNHDASIQLIRLSEPASVPDNPPVPLNFGPSDIANGRDSGRR